jgi:hypothetical protein
VPAVHSESRTATKNNQQQEGLYQAASLVAAAPASNGNQHGSTQSHSIAAMVGASPDSNKDPSSSKRIRVQEQQKDAFFTQTFAASSSKSTTKRRIQQQSSTTKSPGVKRGRPLEYGKDKEEASKLATNEDDLMLDKGIVDDDSWIDSNLFAGDMFLN